MNKTQTLPLRVLTIHSLPYAQQAHEEYEGSEKPRNLIEVIQHTTVIQTLTDLTSKPILSNANLDRTLKFCFYTKMHTDLL